MNEEQQIKVEEIFKEYSNLTSLSEGHYDYMMDREDFIEAINQFLTWYKTQNNEKTI